MLEPEELFSAALWWIVFIIIRVRDLRGFVIREHIRQRREAT